MISILSRNSPRTPCESLAWRVFIAFFLLYALLTRGHFFSTDEVSVYHQTRSLWERGDLSVEPILNTVPGRGGHAYAPYGVGQSILALPLYGLGKGVKALLTRVDASSWTQTLAGPRIGRDSAALWGGEVEIFFVNLLGALAGAALVTVFLLFNIRLGVSPRYALISAVFLGLATHVAGFSTTFFQHSCESLFLLSSFYFLFSYSQTGSSRTLRSAGICAAGMILVRVPAAVVLPVLSLYLAWIAWCRLPTAGLREKLWAVCNECLPFVTPVAAGIFLAALVNYSKFGEFSVSGSYAKLVGFDTPVLVGLHGFLLSPGRSVFLFTPLLLLMPMYFGAFARHYRAEASAIAGMGVTYLLFYANAYLWHGGWCFGPRYLLAAVPLFLLPLGPRLASLRPIGWLGVAPFALAGLFIEILHFSVNISYLYNRENYSRFQPPFGYLYIPEASEIPAAFRALRDWDSCVDFWLRNVAQMQGTGRMLAVGLPLLLLLILAIWRVAEQLPKAEKSFAGAVPPAHGSESKTATV